ncbi:mis18-binding protein 1 [Nematolebias whitei]|uniref:mis18-binding protein 1 n=1 Tax=Nematolebias whitei TaxID=451745 RepID=UPI001897ABE8|nr:mis18-binding protein 1 [Nematolebias whitei]
MASYTLHPGFDSPAKVFAKLKSKVQKEAMLAQEGAFACDNVREQRGAQFNSPRKKTANPWTIDELQDNQRFDSYCNEAQALTLSPISSPQKACGYCRPLEDTSPVGVRGGRAFLESTAVSQPLPLAIRDQPSKGTPQISDLNGFIVSSNTAVKMQPTGNCGRNTFDKEDVHFCPSTELSPMRTRLRKRTCKDPVSNKISRTAEIKRKPPSTEDYTLNKTYMQDLDGRRFPVDQSEMTQDAVTTRLISHMRCDVVLEKLPVMSPAKMFASMKEREKNKKERREVPNSSRRELFDGDKRRLHEFGDTSVLMAQSMSETEESTLKSTPEATMPVDSTDGQSNTDDSPSQPILLEDPLVINSPHILIPKKDKGVFRRNHWPQQKRFPVESVVYLKRWFLRRNEKGLFVDGIHGEDNIPWNSNIIVERVSSSVLKTVSGRVYILVGKMKMNLASDFPRSFVKKFVCGFPPNWNILFEKFLLESKNTDTKNYNKKKAEASINQSVKRKTQKSSKTPASCSPASSSSSTQVTRSGRTIKPPLEYWKGARVILDAHMNVTIHESYDGSQSVSTQSCSLFKCNAKVFCLKQSESAKDEEASIPVRKSRAQSIRNTTKKPADLPESTNEDEWTEGELMKLQDAVSYYPKHLTGYWAKVAQVVGTRSAEDCYKQHIFQGTSEDPKRTGKVTKKKVEASKPSGSQPSCNK